MKWKAKSLCLPLLFSLLTACSYNPFIGNNHTTGSVGGAAIGAGIGAGSVALLGGPKPLIALAGLGGGALGYYLTTLRNASSGIIQAGGQVYNIGDMVGIYIPSDQLFEPNTAELLPQAGPILDSAATVLKRYPNNNILISGNTSGFSRPRWEQRLSEARARRVSAYLWNNGVRSLSTDFKRLDYVGYGNYFPISQTYTNTGIRQNSRIQITSYPNTCDLLSKCHLRERNIGAIEETKDSPLSCGCD